MKPTDKPDRPDRSADRSDRPDRSGDRSDRGGGGDRRGFQRRKGCRFCTEPGTYIDHKDHFLLQPFVTERFKIVPRRISGTCSSHQRTLTLAIKRARHVGILAYSTAQAD